MSIFRRKTREERLEEERQLMINAGWVEPENDNKLWEKLKEFEEKYEAPQTPIMISVDNDTAVLPKGYYNTWCYQGNIVFAHVLTKDRLERTHFPYDTVEENFIFIPASSVVSVTIEGERTEHLEIKRAQLIDRKNVNLKTKNVVHDNRKGLIIIKNGNSQCHVQIPYWDVNKFSGLVEAIKMQSVSQNNETNNMDTLTQLKKLLDSGVLTQEEFDSKKEEILKRI